MWASNDKLPRTICYTSVDTQWRKRIRTNVMLVLRPNDKLKRTNVTFVWTPQQQIKRTKFTPVRTNLQGEHYTCADKLTRRTLHLCGQIYKANITLVLTNLQGEHYTCADPYDELTRTNITHLWTN